MRLKYETGIATLIQFITLGFLNIVTGTSSVVSTCRAGTNDCVSNILLSLIYWLLLTTWFGFLWLLGYTVQERRSKRLAWLLIGAEGMVALISLFNAKHHPDLIGLITSLVDGALAIWVIILAWRVQRSGGQRITATKGRRRRPKQAGPSRN